MTGSSISDRLVPACHFMSSVDLGMVALRVVFHQADTGQAMRSTSFLGRSLFRKANAADPRYWWRIERLAAAPAEPDRNLAVAGGKNRHIIDAGIQISGDLVGEQ